MSNNEIWSADINDFAVRKTLGDLSGFFSKQLTVAPGTRALIVDGGTYLGVVPPGTYTLQSFTDKLKFWQSAKQVDVVLTRDEDVRLDFRVEKMPTVEELLVAVRVQMILKIEDVALFAKNLLGSSAGMSLHEITEYIKPIIAQALRETVRRLSIAMLTLPDVRPILVTAMQDATRTSLSRYGIACIDIQAAEIVNEQYNEQRKKTGEIFLLGMATEQQKKLDEVLNKETLQKIVQRENEIELAVLAEHVEIDGKEADVTLMLRRNDVRKNMRDAILSNRFDKLQSQEELNALLFEIDKGKLLRDDERVELVQTFAARKEDRAAARAHLVRQLELRRKAELDELAAVIAQTQKIQALKNEIAFSQLVEAEDNRKWRDSLGRELEGLDHQIKALTLQQRVTSLENENNRLKDEYADARKEIERLQKKRETDDRFEALERMKKGNREQDEHDANLISQASAQAHAQKMEERNVDADVQKTQITASVEIAKHEATAEAKITDRERELQDKRVQDAQSAGATTLDVVQKITGQAFGAIGQFGGGNVTPGLGAMPPGTPGVIVCPGCRTDNNPVNKFCAKCGKEL